MADEQEYGFEPFFAWDEIPEKLAKQMAAALTEYKRLGDKICEGDHSPETVGAFMKQNDEMGDLDGEIREAIFRVPALVHIAGPIEEEHDDEDDHDMVVQRCTRCRSTLALWHENFIAMSPTGPRRVERDELPWFEEGAVIGKIEQGPSQTAYLIQDREPDKYERECLDMEEAFRD